MSKLRFVLILNNIFKIDPTNLLRMELPGWEFRDSVSEYIFKSRIHVLCSDSAEVRNREPNISHKHGGVMNCDNTFLIGCLVKFPCNQKRSERELLKLSRNSGPFGKYKQDTHNALGMRVDL